MELIFKHTWIIFIVVTILMGVSLRHRSKKYIIANPELAEGYDKLLKGWLIYGNIPWIIMAIGDISTLTNGIWDYFIPRSMNPMVLIFHLSILSIWIIGCSWIYFKDGADFLAKHPGLIRIHGFGGNNEQISSLSIKIYWTIAMLGGIIGMIMIWTWRIPTLNY